MFAHLNVHSYYSMGWGVDSPEVICETAFQMNCSAIALTEINSIYGLFFFLDYARQFGVKPIVGAELSQNGVRATLLVQDRTGYTNLCQLITGRHMNEDFNLSSELLARNEGLVILSDNCKLLSELHEITNAVYAELIKGHPVRMLRNVIDSLKIKPVATVRSFWSKRGDVGIHQLLRAIDSNLTLSTLPPSECALPGSRLCSEAEMRDAFSFCPEAVDNTIEVAELCNWTPDFGVVYPEVEPGMNGDAINVLRDKAYTGVLRRYGEVTDEIRSRMEHELTLIEDNGFAPVFLVVNDIVNHFPRTCGRGSAAASIVSYCLGITHVEPIGHNLFFERFINPARLEPPDIDIDFAWDEREEVFDYVFEKYGVDKAAMVANHVSFQKRAAIREVAKVFGLPDAEIGAVTKRLSHGFSMIGIPVTEHPALREHGFAAPWPDILSLAERLVDIPRHMSVHCGGVVITPGQTADWVPTEIAAKGVRIIQWEKDQTEESGLVKIDLLGNRSIAVIRDTIEAVNEHHGVELDYAALNPLDDPKTQALIAKGDTMGVFYVESPATRLLQKKAGVGDYDHLVLHSSIIRPAANPFIHDYLSRLKGESYEPLHPLIGDLLDDNYGIMVYQEDVTRVAMRLAGFNLADADELRKIISKKHKHRRLADLRRQFYSGAAEHGVSTDAIDRVWDMIMSFAGYSFCKPHSASYALLSFKSAYLRTHYPAEFIAAVISNRGGFYSTFAYVSEARRMGLSVLPLDINESEIKYTGQDDWIRVGFMQIKGLTTEGMERITTVRKQGLFSSLNDCIRRAELYPADARQLIKAGCFDRLEENRTRPELIWQIVLSSDPNGQQSLYRGELQVDHSCQASLFTTDPLPPPKPPEYDERTLLRQEVETLDFLISRHPLELYKEQLKLKPVVKACAMDSYIGQWIYVIGWLVTGKVVPTKKREPMEFVTFEDTTGLIETTFFPKAFRQFGHILSHSRPYRIHGKVEEDFGAVTLTVDDVQFL